ncbi:DUF4129 domain-containing protein [Pedobacter jamesrossensis]|uniref:DUF4129 domain-containing protein n=1 Tax=Pedobacter jamesrossensis TaxID=1908238 RepID=A0ABV8NS71_9SPHI
MPKLIFKFSVVLGLLFASLNNYAQNLETKTKYPLKIDSSKITAAKFNKEALLAYSKQSAFKYDVAQIRDLSLWDRFWMWFWQMIGDLFQGAASNPVSKYFFIGLGVAILVYIVIKIIGAENIFSKKSKEITLPYDILNENIHEIDYESEIRNLVEQGKYRLAVRLLYLRTLKKLTDAEIIQWQPEKTNYNYLTEISKPEIKSEFSQLTHQFDYIWYGDFPVDAETFEPINKSFNHFNSQIK